MTGWLHRLLLLLPLLVLCGCGADRDFEVQVIEARDEAEGRKYLDSLVKAVEAEGGVIEDRDENFPRVGILRVAEIGAPREFTRKISFGEAAFVRRLEREADEIRIWVGEGEKPYWLSDQAKLEAADEEEKESREFIGNLLAIPCCVIFLLAFVVGLGAFLARQFRGIGARDSPFCMKCDQGPELAEPDSRRCSRCGGRVFRVPPLSRKLAAVSAVALLLSLLGTVIAARMVVEMSVFVTVCLLILKALGGGVTTTTTWTWRIK